MRIVVVCGTNRSGALSRTLARIVAGHHEELGHEVDFLDMAELGPEFLLPDSYKEKPPPVQAIVDRFLASDGACFVIPEYNGSYPGVIKLFVDMLPYPEGFESRPCAFVGLAAGQFASLRAVEHFQQVAGYRNAHIYPRRVFIANSYGQFDQDGSIKDEDLAARLRQQAEGFGEYVNLIKGVR